MRYDLVQGLFCKTSKEVFRIFWRERREIRAKEKKPREVLQWRTMKRSSEENLKKKKKILMNEENK